MKSKEQLIYTLTRAMTTDAQEIDKYGDTILALVDKHISTLTLMNPEEARKNVFILHEGANQIGLVLKKVYQKLMQSVIDLADALPSMRLDATPASTAAAASILTAGEGQVQA